MNSSSRPAHRRCAAVTYRRAPVSAGRTVCGAIASDHRPNVADEAGRRPREVLVDGQAVVASRLGWQVHEPAATGSVSCSACTARSSSGRRSRGAHGARGAAEGQGDPSGDACDPGRLIDVGVLDLDRVASRLQASDAGEVRRPLVAHWVTKSKTAPQNAPIAIDEQDCLAAPATVRHVARRAVPRS